MHIRALAFSSVALVSLVAGCNVYDQSMLDGHLSGGTGQGGTSTGVGGSVTGTGGVAGNAGSIGIGGAAQSGGNAGTAGTGSTAGGGGSASTAGGGGSTSTGGAAGSAGSTGAGGGTGTGGRPITDGSVDVVAVDAVADRDAIADRGEAGAESGPVNDDATDVREAASDIADASADVRDANSDAPLCAGSALSCNGTTYAQLTRPVQDDFTLEAWIKTSSSRAGANTWEGLGLVYADVSGGNNDFGTSILNDRWTFGVGNPPNSDIMIQSTSNVTTNQWVHVAVTRIRSTGALQLLVNGVVEASLASTAQTSSLTATANMTIGANTVDGHYFVGLIDEVRVWSVARSAAQITATMRQRLAGNETGLVGYWRFDDVGGTTALDSSPRNATTTFSGTPSSPAWVPSDALCAP